MAKKITPDAAHYQYPKQHPKTRKKCPEPVDSVRVQSVSPKPSAVSRGTQSEHFVRDTNKLRESSIRLLSENSAEDKVITGLEQVAGHSRQGIPRELLQGLQKAASERGAVLLTRPVEPVCRTLISEGWPTKHFRIKAKSSNWGAQAGTIPVLQQYSKLVLKDQNEIDKYTRLAKKSLTEGCAQAVPLAISTDRVNELEAQGYLSEREEQVTHEGTRCLYFKARAGHREEGSEHQQMLVQQPDGLWAVYDADCSPPTAIMVIAQPVEKPGEQPLPMTADIDPLMEVFPQEELDLEKQDRLPLLMISDRVVSRQVDRYRARVQKSFRRGQINEQELNLKLKHYDSVEKKLLTDFYSVTNLFGKAILRGDANLGNVSNRTREMVQHYRRALDRKYPVIHHGVDAHNLATDEKANFPVTVFFPASLNMAQGFCMIFNEQQLLEVLSELMDRGYAIQKNLLWKARLNHNYFLRARAKIAQHLNASILHKDSNDPSGNPGRG